MAENCERATCRYCDKTFSKGKYLRQHVKVVHKVVPPIPGKLLCPFSGCSHKFMAYSELRRHLEEHRMSLDKEEILQFQSSVEFFNWKSAEEQRTTSFYRKYTATKSTTAGKRDYYVCHRSGKFVSTSAGVRNLKAQGSCRIEATCPSTITTLERKYGTIEVSYFKTHCGHTSSLQDLGKLRLTAEERDMIAGKRKAGLPIEVILDEIRDSITNQDSEFRRLHLLTRKDVHNVERSFQIGKVEQLHPADLVSVTLWVNRMQNAGNTVLLFKQQGSEDPNFHLDKDDFLLVLMTPIQEEMLKKFGMNGCICVDSTHGTNGYDFQLTTMLVVDEFCSGFPIAFSLSTKIDYTTMHLFFNSVKDSVGTVNAAVFMSDDAPAYYNAWSAVMGPAGKHLLCGWHVERSWQNNLMKVAGDEQRAMVYKIVTTLLHEPDRSTFSSLLEAAMELLSMYEETEAFGKYFQAKYAGRPEQWAYCFREKACINTNMHLENFHKVLKYTYFQGKVNTRVDRCLYFLLKIVRDKAYDRMVKLAKGSLTGRMKSIISSHKKASDLKEKIICTEHQSVIGTCDCGEANSFSVNSSERAYVVQRLERTCSPDKCHLVCNVCNVCVHDYSCTCLDFVVHCNMCKHIHAVAEFFNSTNSPRSITHTKNNVSDLLLGGAAEQQSQSFGDYRTLLSQKLQKALDCVSVVTASDAVWQEALQDADSLIEKLLRNGKSGSTSTSGILEPHNKKIEKQKTFFSVRQEQQRKKSCFEKPTTSEMALIADSLMSVVETEGSD